MRLKTGVAFLSEVVAGVMLAGHTQAAVLAIGFQPDVSGQLVETGFSTFAIAGVQTSAVSRTYGALAVTAAGLQANTVYLFMFYSYDAANTSN